MQRRTIVSRRKGFALALPLAAALLLPATGVEAASDLIYQPYGSWNGKKIYLSPARHSDAGGRGECRTHRNENDLGYRVAYYAANSYYYFDQYNTTSGGRNLRARGYQVRIGRGTLSSAISNSNSWGATLHIPMHSNADVHNQCSRTTASRFGTVIIYWSTSSGGPGLASELKTRVGTYSSSSAPLRSPGTNDFTCYNPGHPCTTITLGELKNTNAVAAYMESDFHTWYTGYDWLDASYKWAWRVGWAVDIHLGYPRLAGAVDVGPSVVGEASPLAAYPGFGHASASDEARYELEEAARERSVARCMADQGFEYWPAPSIAVTDSTSLDEALATAQDDPNEAYVALLRPDARVDYYMALYGVSDPNNPDADALHDPRSPLGGGCSAVALREIPGVYAASGDLSEEARGLEQAIASDDLVRDAEARWSQCMGGRGYRSPNPSDLMAAVEEAIASGDELLNLIQGGVEADLQDCARQAGLAEALNTARLRHETEFVETNWKRLEEHRLQQRDADRGVD